MIFVTHWTLSPQNRNAAIERFKQTAAAPPKGVRMIARYHDVSTRRGVTILEADDATAIAAWAYEWSDLIEFETYPVVEDAGAAKVYFGG